MSQRELIRDYCLRLDMNKNQLIKTLQISRTTLYYWEVDKVKIPLAQLKKLRRLVIESLAQERWGSLVEPVEMPMVEAQ